MSHFIRHHFYAEVECFDSSAGELKSVEEIRKFKPHVVIVSQISNPLLDYSGSGGASFVETEKHVAVCREILRTFQSRPFLAAILGADKIREVLYRRFKGRCLEWGYDAVSKRPDVNNHTLAIWLKRAREIYGDTK